MSDEFAIEQSGDGARQDSGSAPLARGHAETVRAALRGLIASHGEECEAGAACRVRTDGAAGLAALEEMERDERRLDWLERVGFATSNHCDIGDPGVHSWKYQAGSQEFMPWHWTAHYIGSEFKSARAAIDAAMHPTAEAPPAPPASGSQGSLDNCECPTRAALRETVCWLCRVKYGDTPPTYASGMPCPGCEDQRAALAAPCPCAGMPAAPNELVEQQVDRRDAISLKRSTSSQQTKADELGLAGGGTDGQQRSAVVRRPETECKAASVMASRKPWTDRKSTGHAGTSPEQCEIPSGPGQDCERQPGQTTVPPIAQRLWDLVRHQRGELHTAGLVTDAEYSELAKDHGAVARLESYDQLRVELEAHEVEQKKVVEYARQVRGSRDVHSIYEVLDLVPTLRAELAKAERWEIGFRNIVTAIIGPRSEFEIPQIVEAVKTLHTELASSWERERKFREALINAAVSLDSYDKSYGGGRGEGDAVDIARLLGFDGNSNEAVEWLQQQRAAPEGRPRA